MSNRTRISHSARCRGLTLIELVIVLASMGMLTAILFPVLSTQRGKARRASCQSNLKQIGLGLIRYCRDYDETYPRATIDNPRRVWQQAVQPYVESVAVFTCPSNPATWTNPPVSGVVGPNPSIPRSYAINHRVSYADKRVTLANINSVATKIMVAESSAVSPDYGSAWWSKERWAEGFASHLGTANYLFADGHVKYLSPMQTAKPVNMWGGMDGGVCKTRSINCNTPEPVICEGLELLESQS